MVTLLDFGNRPSISFFNFWRTSGNTRDEGHRIARVECRQRGFYRFQQSRALPGDDDVFLERRRALMKRVAGLAIMQRGKLVAALRAGVEAAGVHFDAGHVEALLKLSANQILQSRVGDVDVDFGFDITRSFYSVGPLV